MYKEFVYTKYSTVNWILLPRDIGLKNVRYFSWKTIRFEIFRRLTQKYGTRNLPKPRVLQNKNKKVRNILLNKTINIVYGETVEYKRIQFTVKYLA